MLQKAKSECGADGAPSQAPESFASAQMGRGVISLLVPCLLICKTVKERTDRNSGHP